MPLGKVARQRAGDAAIDRLVLQGRHHFTKGHRHRAGAERGHQLGLRAATDAHFLALQIGQALELGVAVNHLRRIGRDAEEFHAEFFAEQFFVHRLGRFGDPARGLDIGDETGNVHRLVGRVIRRQIGQHRGADFEHALAHQAQHFRAFQAHLVEALCLGSDRALGFFGERLGPERQLVIFVRRQAGDRADHFQIGLGQILGLRGSARQQQGNCSKNGSHQRFQRHGLLL